MRLNLLLFTLLVGCSSRESTVGSYQVTNKASLGTMANSSMALGSVPTLNAHTITSEHLRELKRKTAFNQASLSDQLYYMGSKEGFHYLMYCPALNFRSMYRISQEDYQIKEQFPLTSDSSLWRNENGNHWSYPQPNIFPNNIPNTEVHGEFVVLHPDQNIPLPEQEAQGNIFKLGYQYSGNLLP